MRHAVYSARLVAARSTCCPASLDGDPEWPVCRIDLPTGQGHRHIAQADLLHRPRHQRFTVLAAPTPVDALLHARDHRRALDAVTRQHPGRARVDHGAFTVLPGAPGEILDELYACPGVTLRHSSGPAAHEPPG